MATGPNYRVAFRRRREAKTDYRLRRGLVMSKFPRLVIRGSSRHIGAQLVKAEASGDKVMLSAYSSELSKKYGWQGGCGNIPAAYLTGFLCGNKAMTQGFKEVILDIGLQNPSKGSRIFAVVKGVTDAGVSVPHDESKLPSKERLEGQHIAEYAKQSPSNLESYLKRFSKQSSSEPHPAEIGTHVAQMKDKISASFKKTELSTSGTEEEKVDE